MYITGLVLGVDTSDLHLGDLIFGIGGEIFNSTTNYKEMISRYNKGTYGRVYREHDFEQICIKVKKEGSQISYNS